VWRAETCRLRLGAVLHADSEFNPAASIGSLAKP